MNHHHQSSLCCSQIPNVTPCRAFLTVPESSHSLPHQPTRLQSPKTPPFLDRADSRTEPSISGVVYPQSPPKKYPGNFPKVGPSKCWFKVWASGLAPPPFPRGVPRPSAPFPRGLPRLLLLGACPVLLSLFFETFLLLPLPELHHLYAR